ncbi:GNAT family N-acetyltransferase [Providencia sp.]|uniref:GNAT family N-acetyltransferase n=1 Tax=Providencia sp. TaxID=589 RepID=UPI003F9D62B8
MMNQNSNKGYSPIFRPANQNDILALCRIDSVNSSERYQEIIQWVTQDNAYLIEISDTIVAYGIFHSHFFGQNFIELLMVDQQYRRQGLALTLIENFKQLRKTPKLFTSTNQSNVATQKLLTQTGFITSGVIENLDKNDPELIYCYNP